MSLGVEGFQGFRFLGFGVQNGAEVRGLAGFESGILSVKMCALNLSLRKSRFTRLL